MLQKTGKNRFREISLRALAKNLKVKVTQKLYRIELFSFKCSNKIRDTTFLSFLVDSLQDL